MEEEEDAAPGTPCQYCGKTLTKHGPGRAIHLKTCKAKHASQMKQEEEAASSPPPAAAAATTPAERRTTARATSTDEELHRLNRFNGDAAGPQQQEPQQAELPPPPKQPRSLAAMAYVPNERLAPSQPSTSTALVPYSADGGEAVEKPSSKRRKVAHGAPSNLPLQLAPGTISGYKGVHFDKNRKLNKYGAKWYEASTGKTRHLGWFSTAKEAARCFAEKLWSEQRGGEAELQGEEEEEEGEDEEDLVDVVEEEDLAAIDDCDAANEDDLDLSEFFEQGPDGLQLELCEKKSNVTGYKGVFPNKGKFRAQYYTPGCATKTFGQHATARRRRSHAQKASQRWVGGTRRCIS